MNGYLYEAQRTIEMVATPERAEHELVTPDEKDIPRIKKMQDFLREETSYSAQLVAPNGKKLDIPESVCEVLRQVAPLMSEGATIGIMPLRQELTTQQAADLLNVSRPFLIKLLDDGAIPYRRLSTHRRIRFGDVMAYKQRRSAGRREALDELTALAEAYGDYD